MKNSALIAKYKNDGYPVGQIDIPDIAENANFIIQRGDKTLTVVANASLGSIHAKGYFPPYLNHRKIAMLYMDTCIDTNERITFQ